MKNWTEQNTNEDSTDDLQIKKEKVSEMVAIIDTILTLSKLLASDMRYLYQKQHINPYNNDEIVEAMTDWCTHKDVMYLAGLIEGSKIAPVSDEDIKNREFIRKAYERLKP